MYCVYTYLSNLIFLWISCRTSESFSPICLPRYNPMAFLYAYVNFLDVSTRPSFHTSYSLHLRSLIDNKLQFLLCCYYRLIRIWCCLQLVQMLFIISKIAGNLCFSWVFLPASNCSLFWLCDDLCSSAFLACTKWTVLNPEGYKLRPSSWSQMSSAKFRDLCWMEECMLRIYLLIHYQRLELYRLAQDMEFLIHKLHSRIQELPLVGHLDCGILYTVVYIWISTFHLNFHHAYRVRDSRKGIFLIASIFMYGKVIVLIVIVFNFAGCIELTKSFSHPCMIKESAPTKLNSDEMKIMVTKEIV